MLIVRCWLSFEYVKKINENHNIILVLQCFSQEGAQHVHLPCSLRQSTFFSLVCWMTSRISPCTTVRSFPLPFLMLAFGSTIMQQRTLMGPSNCPCQNTAHNHLLLNLFPAEGHGGKSGLNARLLDLRLEPQINDVYLKLFSELLFLLL